MRATLKKSWEPVSMIADPGPAMPAPPKIREAYAEFRLNLIHRILREKLTPTQVATILGEAADQHPEITYDECRRMRERGDSWK